MGRIRLQLKGTPRYDPYCLSHDVKIISVRGSFVKEKEKDDIDQTLHIPGVLDDKTYIVKTDPFSAYVR